MKIVKFDESFSKLSNKEFMTIRDHDKHIFNNQIVIIKTPSKQFKAKCKSVGVIKFRNIPIEVLKLDLDNPNILNHEQALKIMKGKYYKNLEMNSTVWMYTFVRCS